MEEKENITVDRGCNMLDLIDIIQMELTGLYGQEVIREMGEIIRLYDKYEGTGQHWKQKATNNHLPTR